MQEMQNKKLIVVLGMHRSGTSAVTRSLQTLGVDLGDALVPAVAGDNDKGFWEDADTLSINQDIMSALDVSWCPLSPYRWSRIDADKMQEFRLQAMELLIGKLKDVPAFGLKDPRLTRLLPFWQPIFRELGVDVHYVLVVRNPLSVAASLKRRNGFAEFRSHLLWLRHVVPSFLDTCGLPRVVVSYERMMADPEVQLRRIAAGLDMPLNEESSAFLDYTRNFLSPELQHEHHTVDELDVAGDDVPVQLRHVYAALRGMASDAISDGDSTIYELFLEVDRYLSGMESSLAYIDRLEERNEELLHTIPTEAVARIAELESAYQKLAEGQAWLESQRDEWEKLAESREQHVAELTESIKVSEQLRYTSSAELTSRVAELESAYQALSEGQAWLESQRDAWEKLAAIREQRIAELSALVKEFDRAQHPALPEVRGRLTELEVAYDALLNGNTWLESQRDAWEKLAASRDQRIAELSVALKKYEEGNAWLESQRQAWELQAKAFAARLLEFEGHSSESTQGV
ncbi:hypothetical protein CA260_03440 [Dyella jiangningensis]|uniref:Sulfotransferase family protein n=2 Tax=Dyella jiangningensis TaxID=1379159 RepID=A0A328P9Q0_9GAMM|nr:hypothetical protein CA260_03440 [Dyella jiangningensis]